MPVTCFWSVEYRAQQECYTVWLSCPNHKSYCCLFVGTLLCLHAQGCQGSGQWIRPCEEVLVLGVRQVVLVLKPFLARSRPVSTWTFAWLRWCFRSSHWGASESPRVISKTQHRKPELCKENKQSAVCVCTFLSQRVCVGNMMALFIPVSLLCLLNGDNWSISSVRNRLILKFIIEVNKCFLCFSVVSHVNNLVGNFAGKSW